jgi:hypothetical protein
MLKKVSVTLKAQGIGGLLHAARRVIAPFRARCLKLCRQLLEGKTGLEIGGPSGVFGRHGLLPLYPVIASLDNCNFATETTWAGSVREGAPFNFSRRRPPGRQYVAEATNLSQIRTGAYNFMLASHVIEHTANPLLALSEWIRVLDDDGVLVLLIPHKDGTFDHRRPTTTLEHLVQDFDREVSEDDQTHLAEILQLHDLKRDPEAGTPEAFRQRSEANADNRCLHHHVFDTRLAVRLLDRMGLQILAVEAARPNHIVAVAQKPGKTMLADNGKFLATTTAFLDQSPFPSDRQLAPMSLQSSR